MADLLKQLVTTQANRKPAATTNTTVYTVPGGVTAMCSRIVICNQGSVPATFRLAIVPSGGSVGDNYYWLAYDVPLGPNESINFPIGGGMAAGDFIVVYATTASLSFTPFGMEIS